LHELRPLRPAEKGALQASPVGAIDAVSTIRTALLTGARVQCITPFGTTKPWFGNSSTERP
jgi:hypothetical protein